MGRLQVAYDPFKGIVVYREKLCYCDAGPTGVDKFVFIPVALMARSFSHGIIMIYCLTKLVYSGIMVT